MKIVLYIDFDEPPNDQILVRSKTNFPFPPHKFEIEYPDLYLCEIQTIARSALQEKYFFFLCIFKY